MSVPSSELGPLTPYPASKCVSPLELKGEPNNLTNYSRINITHVPSASGGSVHSPGKEDQYILLGIEGSTENNTVNLTGIDQFCSSPDTEGSSNLTRTVSLYTCIPVPAVSVQAATGMFRLSVAYRTTASVHSTHRSAVLRFKRTKQSLQVAFALFSTTRGEEG